MPRRRRPLRCSLLRDEPDGKARAVLVNDGESPLAWLMARRQITAEEFAAGERLRRDFERGQMGTRVTMRWDAAIGSGQRGRSGVPGGEPGGSALDGRRRVARALDAVGPELSGMLLEVCCLAAGLEAAERRLALPARAGKVVLQLGLTRLARHYGLIAPPAPPAVIAQWALPDFRPGFGLTPAE